MIPEGVARHRSTQPTLQMQRQNVRAAGYETKMDREPG